MDSFTIQKNTPRRLGLAPFRLPARTFVNFGYVARLFIGGGFLGIFSMVIWVGAVPRPISPSVYPYLVALGACLVLLLTVFVPYRTREVERQARAAARYYCRVNAELLPAEGEGSESVSEELRARLETVGLGADPNARVEWENDPYGWVVLEGESPVYFLERTSDDQVAVYRAFSRRTSSEARVFVSFRTNPDEPLARDIAERLTEKGLDVTLIHDIREAACPYGPGDPRAKGWISLYLSEEVQRAGCLLVVATRDTWRSDWVAHEFEAARSACWSIILLWPSGEDPTPYFVPRPAALGRWLPSCPIVRLDVRHSPDHGLSQVHGAVQALPRARGKLKGWALAGLSSVSLAFLFSFALPWWGPVVPTVVALGFLWIVPSVVGLLRADGKLRGAEPVGGSLSTLRWLAAIGVLSMFGATQLNPIAGGVEVGLSNAADALFLSAVSGFPAAVIAMVLMTAALFAVIGLRSLLYRVARTRCRRSLESP